MIKSFVLAASAIAVAIATPALSRSKAAAYLIQQEIAEGCESHHGTMDDSGAIERDLDGDGLPDLIIAHDGIRCSGSSTRSQNCGMQVCAVTFYVRRGQLLQNVHTMLGAGIRVGPERIPKVHMFAHGGSRGFVRWNGHSFQ